MALTRRSTLAGLAAAMGAMAYSPAATALDLGAAGAGYARVFNPRQVDSLAASLARRPYVQPPRAAGSAAALDYDAWRQIRFQRTRARWAGDSKSLFRFDYFPTGYIFEDPVQLFEVQAGRARPVMFDPADFGSPAVLAPAMAGIRGISGVRLQSPINRPEVFDEVAVFQGASYFRSLGRGNQYGLSARGVAVGSGEPGEEFPAFRVLWLEKPEAGQPWIRVHALLDGPSLSGAYHITITPGVNTLFDIQALLFPRRDMKTIGLGAQSSMFMFGGPDRRGADDFREAVHDSQGLLIHSGSGERIWRSLTRPHAARVTVFEDAAIRGFGLSQRDRTFAAYNDLEVRYERRPSLWVEPVGDWGPGAVHLVELPADHEGADNIAAFWRPAAPLRAGRGAAFSWRLHWGDDPAPASSLARVASARTGLDDGGRRLFVVDFHSPGPEPEGVRGEAQASAGSVTPVILTKFPDQPLIRAAFRFQPPPSGEAELRLRLVGDNGPLSESWRFPWTS